MKKWFLIVGLLSVFGIQLIEAQSIRGVVISASGSGVANVNVGLVGTNIGSTTDENGNFVIENLGNGHYTVETHIIGYIKERKEVVITNNKDLFLNFNLQDFQYEIPMMHVLGEKKGIFESVPGSLSYLDAKEINTILPISGNEVFRRAPGVHVVDEEGAGMRINIGIRGLDPGRSRSVLMLEDGIPIALAPYGEPEMYYTPPIDRMAGIEILKGSGSIMYGPQTIGGVVNFITADPPEKSKGQIKVKGGQGGFFSSNVTYGNSNGKSGFRINYLRKQADNLGPTRFKIDDFSLKFKHQISKKSILTFKAGFYNEISNSTYVGLTQSMYDAGGKFDFERMAPDDELQIRRYSASATHQYIFNNKTKLSTTAFAFTTTRNWRRQDFAYSELDTAGNIVLPSRFSGQIIGEEFINTSGGAILLRNSTGNRNRTFEIAGVETKLNHNYQIGSTKNHLNIGARLMTERAFEQRINGSLPKQTSGNLRDDETRTGLGISGFVHNQLKFNSRFSITAGTRVEIYDYERNIQRSNFIDTSIVASNQIVEVIPGAGFNLILNEKINLFGGIHKGFAPPRIKDAISSDGEAYQLEAERSWNAEIGLRSNISNGIDIEMTAFYMDFSNQIVPVAEFAGGVGAGLVNGGATLHQGIEGGFILDFGQWLDWSRFGISWDANLTYVAANYSSDRIKGGESISDNRTPYAPNFIASSAFTLEHESGLLFRSVLTHVSEQFSNDLNTIRPSTNGRIGLIPSYTLVDASMIYSIEKINTSFQLSIKNIFNERPIVSRRPQGIRVALPRFITAGVTFDF